MRLIPCRRRRCRRPAGRFYLSVDGYGGQVWGWSPGQIFDQYIIDVDGERLIVEAWRYPGTSEVDLAAQRAVVDSIQLDPAD